MARLCIVVLLFTFATFKVMSNSPVNDTIQLPFVENFDSGTFIANGWVAQSGDWHIDTLEGLQVPCTGFHPLAPLTDYNVTLESAWIDGNSVTDCRIRVDFSHKLLVVNPTGNEKLFLEVFCDTSWYTVFEMSSNNSNGSFRERKINVTKYSRDKVFKIRFRASGLNSNDINSWLIDNINVHMFCEPPENLGTSIPNPAQHPCRVLLQWDAPCKEGINSQWMHYDDGTNFDAVGYNNGGTFKAAIRITAAQLNSFENGTVEKVKFFAREAGSTFSLMIWKGNTTPLLVYSQPVDTYEPMSWNEYNLDSLIPLTQGTDLWIGYEVTHPAGLYSAGVDAGPAVSGFGDMIWGEEEVWESMSVAYELNYNWNIQAWVADQPNDTCNVLSYNVYANDGIFIGNTEETSFLHVMRGLEEYTCYRVTALYIDGESAKSYESCAYTEGCPTTVDDVMQQQIRLYPSPASEQMTVELTPGTLSGIVTDLSGREIEKLSVNPSIQTLVIDVRSFRPGIYLLKLITSQGMIVKKFLVGRD